MKNAEPARRGSDPEGAAAFGLEQRPLAAALAVVLPMLLAVLAYLGALGGGFVWDDFVLADGSGIGGGTSIGQCFRTAFLDHFYRPLVSVSFLVDRKLWPDNPTAYHWVNILLHAAGTGLVVLLMREALESTALGAISGVLFALHPVHAGATAWIGGRTDALGCLWSALFALGLVSGARRIGTERGLRIGCSVVAYALAVFTKEQSLFLLPAVPLAFACFRPKRGLVLPSDGWYLTAPFAVAAVLYLSMGAFLGMPGPAWMGATIGEQLSRFGMATAAYAELLLVPNQWVLHAYSLGPWEALSPWSVAAGYGVAIGAAVLSRRWWRTERPLAWLLAFVVLAILPVSNLFPLPFLLFAHYRGAVAGIGAVGILAAVLGRLRWRGWGFRSAPAAVSIAALSGWYAVQLVQAIPSWRSEAHLFSAIAEYDPNSVVPHYMLARLAMQRADYPEAEKRLSLALDYLFGTKSWREPRTALRLVQTDRTVLLRARQNQGNRQDPHLFLAMLFRHLGYARMHSGNVAGATAAFETSLAWDPSQADTHHGLAWCYAKVGQYERAEQHLAIALEREPTAERHQLMAQILELQRRWDEARTQWRLSERAR